MSPDDLDRLADYSAGVLDDLAAAEVTQLIETDPTWQSTYTGLIEANAIVRAQLQGAARTQLEPMPADIVARLNRSFAEADLMDRARIPTLAGHPEADAGSGALGTVTSLDQARTRRRPRLLRIATAAAAAVAVIGGIGVVSQVTRGDISATTNRDTAAPGLQPEMAPTGASADGYGTGITFLRSGIDYRASTLARLERSFMSSQTTAPTTPRGQNPPGLSPPEDVPTALMRLTDPADLATCLAMVQAAHTGRPAVVDYASYDGSPALLVLIRQSNSTTVVVVGPECGLTSLNQLATAVLP